MKLETAFSIALICLTGLGLIACQTSPNTAPMLIKAVTQSAVSKQLPKDSDGDGVSDEIDECPATPPDIMIDEKGCPPTLLPGENDIKMEVRIYYGENSSEIDSKYYEDLDQANKQLQNYLDAVMLIDGHISKREDHTPKQTLSKHRAESFKNYLLVKHRVNLERIKTYDCGRKQPLAHEDTVEGSEFNQRVYAVVSNSKYDIERLNRNEIGEEQSCQLF